MKNNVKLGAAIAAGAGLFLLSGCAKATEPWNDADVKFKEDGPAELYSMPDGFSNFASKCDKHGNRVYTLFHGDNPYGSIAVIPQDPSCK